MLAGTQGVTIKAPPNDYAIIVGNGSTRVADNCVFQDMQFKQQDATSLGGVKLNYAVDTTFTRVTWSNFERLASYGLVNNVSWETQLYRCRFFNLQNALLLSNVGYVYAEDTYFDAIDFGAHGATENYGVNCSNGAIYARGCRFETNGTTGTANNITFYGASVWDMCIWEGGQNLYDIRINGPLNYPCYVIGTQPTNKVGGTDNYPG